MDDFVITKIKECVKHQIETEIDECIAKEVDLFTKQLISKRDKYAAEVMDGIKVFHDRDPKTLGMNYTIVFKNDIYLHE